jgi:hypothetical protein
MVCVLLVKVVFRLGLQLRRKLLENALENSVYRFLLRGIAVPDGDEMRVEPNRETYTAKLVTCIESASKLTLKP